MDLSRTMTRQGLTRARRFALAALSGSLLLTACTSVHTTSEGAIGLKRRQMMSPLVSEAQLDQSAQVAYAEVLQKAKSDGGLNTDPAMTARVRAVAGRIIPQVGAFRQDALKWQWQVNVIKSDELNAWCMPGGKIAFYSGIIQQLNLTDDEIAAIMGHEIAHALREHARERASEQATAGLLINAGAAGFGLGSSGADLGRLAYQTTFGLKHSRQHETEADRIGVELAARAGYDPRAAITLWQKMAARSGGKSQPEFLSTHPSASTRIKDLQDYSTRVITPPPQGVASEFLTMEGKKFSSSKNVVIYVRDVLSRYQPDALRYFISIAGPENSDADFTWAEFVRRNNSELVAGWGNLVNRTAAMIAKNFGEIPAPGGLEPVDEELLALRLAGPRVGQERLQIHGTVVDDLAVTGNDPGDGLRRRSLGVGIQACQTFTNDVQREVLVALHRQGVAQTLQVRL